MMALVKESEVSSLNGKDFIATKGIRSHIFYYWKRQYLNSKVRIKKKSPFIPITIAEKTASTDGHIEFFFSNGNRAVIKGEISASMLRTLMGN